MLTQNNRRLPDLRRLLAEARGKQTMADMKRELMTISAQLGIPLQKRTHGR